MKERWFTQADVKLPLDQAIAIFQLSSVDLVLDRSRKSWTPASQIRLLIGLLTSESGQMCLMWRTTFEQDISLYPACTMSVSCISVFFLYFCFDLGITPSYPLSYQKVQLSASTLINNLLTRLQVYLLLTWINSCLNLGNCVIKYTVSRLLTHIFFCDP